MFVEPLASTRFGVRYDDCPRALFVVRSDVRHDSVSTPGPIPGDAAPVPIELDTSAFPIVKARFSGAVRDDELVDYEARLVELMQRCDARGERFVLVSRAVDGPGLSAKQRRLEADFVKSHYGLIEGTVSGLAVVVQNALHRGVMNAIFWIVTLPYPHVVVRTEDEAEGWARERLALVSELGRATA